MRELKAVPGTSLRSNLKKLEKFSRDLVLSPENQSPQKKHGWWSSFPNIFGFPRQFLEGWFWAENFICNIILFMEKILHHLGCIKPCKSSDPTMARRSLATGSRVFWATTLPIHYLSTGEGFLPSTVCQHFQHTNNAPARVFGMPSISCLKNPPQDPQSFHAFHRSESWKRYFTPFRAIEIFGDLAVIYEIPFS